MPITLPKPSWLPRLRRRAEETLDQPFARLARHFLKRLMSGETADTEFDLGIGAVLGLLAAPGAFQSLLLLDKYSSLLAWIRRRPQADIFITSAPDKYLFLSLAMAITGIVTVLKWDRILPDAQDYLNLAPLPMRRRTILLANAAAIAMAVVVFAVDVNAASMVCLPLFVTASANAGMAVFANFASVHAFCLLLASLFTFCCVFAVFGMLAAVLPREIFRAWSAWLRGAVLVAFIMLMLSAFAGPAAIQKMTGMGWVPSFWFLGLYQDMQNRATPALARMAQRAINGSGVAFAAMIVSYALSYRRRFAGILESGRRPSAQRLFAGVLALLDALAYRAAGFHRASYRFVVRALLRNEAHRLCLAVSLGLGWLLALESGSPEEGGLIAAYLLILGLRVAFALPAAVPANWIFRSVLDTRATETHAVARHVMLSFLGPCVAAPAVAWEAWRAGLRAGALDGLYVLALSLCLIEILLAGYRKIPLTCPMPGFRDNLPLMCLVQFLGFEVFTSGGAALERWILADPPRFLLVPAAMVAAWYWSRKRLKDALEAGELETGLLFESAPAPAIERLHLSE